MYIFFYRTGDFWPHPHGLRLPGEAVPGGAGSHRHHVALRPHGGNLRPGEVSAKITASWEGEDAFSPSGLSRRARFSPQPRTAWGAGK